MKEGMTNGPRFEDTIKNKKEASRGQEEEEEGVLGGCNKYRLAPTLPRWKHTFTPFKDRNLMTATKSKCKKDMTGWEDYGAH